MQFEAIEKASTVEKISDQNQPLTAVDLGAWGPKVNGEFIPVSRIMSASALRIEVLGTRTRGASCRPIEG